MTAQAGHPGSDPDVYTQDFIDEAVLRVIEGRRARGEAYRSLRALCREHDVPKITLLRWVRRAEDQAASTFDQLAEPAHHCGERPAGAASVRRRRTGTPFDDRIAALYHHNERLVRENEVLKAALILLARAEDCHT
jgi:transposase-like protein